MRYSYFVSLFILQSAFLVLFFALGVHSSNETLQIAGFFTSACFGIMLILFNLIDLETR